MVNLFYLSGNYYVAGIFNIYENILEIISFHQLFKRVNSLAETKNLLMALVLCIQRLTTFTLEYANNRIYIIDLFYWLANLVQ